MNLNNYTQQEYLKFCTYEGAQYIASEYAIIKILQLVKQFNITSVLEIGLGIGSITSTVLSAFSREELTYVGTENNSFCLNSLRENLIPDNYDRLVIVPSIHEVIQLNMKYDLVIIDGANDNLVDLKNQLSRNAIFVIEGDRKPQELEIKSIFPSSRFVSMLSYRKNHALSNRDPLHWQGGIKVFFIEPSMKQELFWVIEKIKTKYAYFYRRNIYGK